MDENRGRGFRFAAGREPRQRGGGNFYSTRVEKVDDNYGKIYGTLTIRGVSHEVVLVTEYSGQSKMWGKISAGLIASSRINRKDYGLNWNQVLESGGNLEGDDINVSVDLGIVKVEEGQQVAA
ncbi:MAG: YceI family protein [Saprospiraceae bacterium]|nr:YceI family protein [Saprospiraceae bacterium]